MQCSSSHSVRILALLAAALITLTLSACLGGDPREAPDAAVAPPDAPPGDQPDARDDAPDAQPGDIDAGVDEPPPPQACVDEMAGAPTGAIADFDDAMATATVNTWGRADLPAAGDPNYPGGKYRTLTPDGNGDIHPGCSTAGLSYTPASIAGYPCAAKQYPFPTGVSEDTSKPIVILIHGNSDSPVSWEAFLHPDPASLPFPADTEPRDQLAELLPAAGYRTIAADFRTDLVLTDDPGGSTGNFPSNFDHGWAVPIAESLIKQVIIANPGRRVSLIGFSLGATVARDALRRLFVQLQNEQWDINVFTRVEDVIAAAGAHHGVISYDALCGNNTTMRGTAACELGQRNTYTQVPFHEPLNGPALTGAGEAFGGWYETPCADASYAFGLRDACGGHAVEYTTITMQDISQGAQQDEFVSEHASRLYPIECATNVINDLNDFDTSGYFFNGVFRNHYGAVRGSTGLTLIVQELAD
jgi:pimeloyl-ACP methyl ester carboxylesterase